jgi:hypothetical protein
VKHLVDLGITSDMAMDQMYAVYGAQTSVTKIINAIIDDKKRGLLRCHVEFPVLRVLYKRLVAMFCTER